MGTLLQGFGFSEAEFRGERFADHPRDLKGCHDLLCLTQPQSVAEVHRRYLEAGADIIETNSFNANTPSLEDYGLEAHVRELNRAAAQIARETADLFEGPRWVAGVLGPTNRCASISPRVEDPGARDVDFEQLANSYAEACRGLLEGGADLLLVETIFDTLNAKAALWAIEEVFLEREAAGRSRSPIMISLTLSDASGRSLSGQTVEAFWHSVQHAQPFSVGLNCALGAREMLPHLEQLSQICDRRVSVHPNAGLPNELGGYEQSPEEMAEWIGDFASRGLINIAGGCCGTHPAHIAAISQKLQEMKPRLLPKQPPRLRLSGLDPLTLRPDSLFLNIGERSNMAGSARFCRLIRAGDEEGALAVAQGQVERGAQMIDLNMDDALLDAAQLMPRFLRRMAAEPEIARVPVVLDSSRWEALEAGLRCLQGKGVVNSISLKEGEAIFLEQARKIRRYGAAVIVMAFDEEGQADTLARRLSICKRAYTLLQADGFPPEEIIFDLNVFAVGTGIEAHRSYALDFIQATRILKAQLPGISISGGISNVSFAFRGNQPIREALHSVFLYHAVQAGMDMGIVNAGQLAIYEELPKELRERAEDLILNRRSDATERLLELAKSAESSLKGETEERNLWRQKPVQLRLTHSLVHGINKYIKEDSLEALEVLGSALEVIEGPLMEGMGRVGVLFGAGKMFLPQVIKSARVMKQAVASLAPALEAAEVVSSHRTSLIMATVKGDVHDIGKKIVSVVLECNGVEVIDLGVMVPKERILDEAERQGADAIGLSGLITPSLEEMVRVAAEMERRGMKIPLLIGGATTSPKHTALKIAPLYSGEVYQVKDASLATQFLSRALDPQEESFREEVRAKYAGIRARFAGGQRKLLSIEAARKDPHRPDWNQRPVPPAQLGIQLLRDLPISTLRPYIDWGPFFKLWSLKGRFPALLDDPRQGAQAQGLYQDAQDLLGELEESGALKAHGILGLYPANSRGDDLLLFADESRDVLLTRFHYLRQQSGPSPQRCLADLIAPEGIPDWMGCFAVHAGEGLEALVKKAEARQDDYRVIMLKALADRLAEAFAEYLHERVRREFWGYSNEDLSLKELIAERYQGIRPAPGYPACPDHSEKGPLFELLKVPEHLGLRLSENFAMLPAAAVSGFLFAHPEARYFGLGRLGEDQLKVYAQRKGQSILELRRWLGLGESQA